MTKKVKFTLEYPVRCSPTILYQFLSTPSGLQEWFADQVDDQDGLFTFSWNGTSEEAELVESEENKHVKFRWVESPESEFFEFNIEKSEVTSQTILIINDFADKKDIKDQSRLWEAQVKDLFHRLGN
ncbi:MAG: START-like domain-containing protein [Ginsengibacter sp.]